MRSNGLIAGKIVGRIALGPMRCSYEPLPNRTQAIRAIHAALDAGADFIDTADCYAPNAHQMHHNEALIGEALSQRADADQVLVATKVGHVRTETSIWERKGHPSHLRAACERSIRALGMERIGLLQLHSPDPAVPFEDQVGTLVELRKEGLIGAIGLCNIGRKQLAVARAMTPIASVQSRLSITAREAEGLVRYCTEQEIPFLAWAPLGGADAKTIPSITAIAQARGVSPQQISLAWLLSQSPYLFALVGSTRPETARDSMAAGDLLLSRHEIEELNCQTNIRP